MKQLNKLTKRLLIVSLAFFSFGFVHAQIQVSGKLTDSKGEPLVAASVAELGTTNGTFTEYDGTWSLTVKSAESVLEFSYVGLKTQTLTVGSKRTFNVALKLDAIEIGTVMKIGYASAKPEDVTSAITQVAGKELSNKPVLGVDQALQGKAAGVQIRSNSGTPGAAMNITIRGLGSATGDGRPLYVVDGIPVGYEWKGDPQNVESLSILKDASSCAIYGARGANGVILITTKGGNSVAKEEFSNISFDGYRGIQSTWKRIDVADAYEYADIKNKEYLASGKDTAYVYRTTGLLPYQRKFADISNTNWQDEVFRKAIIEKYKVTIDGGSKKSSWSASAGYLNQEGIVKGTSYDKYDIGYKYMYQLTEKLDFGMSSGFSLTNQSRMNEGNIEQSLLGSALIADPTIPVYDTTGNWAQGIANTFANPVGIIENTNDNTRGFGVGMNVWAEYKIIKGLNFRSSYNYNKWGNDREVFKPIYWISINQSNNETYLARNIQGGHGWVTSNSLTYSYNIKDDVDTNKIKHGFRVLAAQEALYEFQETYNVSVAGLDEGKNMRYLAAGQDGKVFVNSWELPNEHTMLSYLGRLEYSFMDKYLVNGSVRRDASSRFGPNQKWGNFPSVGFAWKVNKESFFYNNELLKNNVSLFKIRGGWGKIGNENIGNYRYVASVNSNDSRSGYNFGGTAVPGATPISVPNADVHWEEATSTNIGAEINLWKNKLMFTADYYVKNNVDNLIYITVPGVVGIDGSGNNPVSNEGKVRNQGVEFSTTYRSSYKGDSSKYELTYNAGFNFTYNINEVTYQETPRQGGRVDRVGFTANTLTGYPIAGFWGYKVDGIYQNWEEVNAGAQPSAKPGDYKIVDVNGDGQITTDDITYLGSPHPDFTYGLNANLGYAGFDLGISFQGVYGNKIYNATKWYLDGGYLGSNYSTRRLDVWAPDNTDSDQPTDPNWFTGKEQRAVSSAFIEDGSYLRLKNITLGYTLPTKYAEKIKLSNVRVYGQVQNALTFTKYSGFDPEIGTNTELNYEGPEFGVDRGVYPQARSVVFGVNLQF